MGNCYGRPWPAVYTIFVQIIHQIQVLTEPLCAAEQRTGYQISLVNLQREAKLSVNLQGYLNARQTCSRIRSVSITVVRFIETLKTTPKHPKPPPNNYRTYNARKKNKDTHCLLGGDWHCARIHTALALCKNTYSDRAKRGGGGTFFDKLILVAFIRYLVISISFHKKLGLR